MKKKYKLIGIVLALIICLFLLSNQKPAPQISVKCVIDNIDNGIISASWTVANLSDQQITFDDDCLLQIQLNNKEIPYRCPSQVLSPGQEKTLHFKIYNYKEGISHNLNLTAECNEGTKATYKMTIQ